jgi:hypothetical protein
MPDSAHAKWATRVDGAGTSGWERRRAAAETGAAQEIEAGCREGMGDPPSGRWREEKRKQGKNERGRNGAIDRGAMDRAVIVPVVAIARTVRAASVRETQFEAGTGRMGRGKLCRRKAAQNSVEDKRIGGDPANKLSSQTHSWRLKLSHFAPSPGDCIFPVSRTSVYPDQCRAQERVID